MKLNDFDKVANWYDRLAKLVFGDAIKKAQTHFLEKIPKEGKLLIIGGGTGWILKELFILRPNLEVHYIEASTRMLALAKKNSPESFNVRFIHGTEKNMPETEYDCIITNFFLDVFKPKQLLNVVEKLKNHLAFKGVWLVTDFQKTAKFFHTLLIKVMHLFFRLISNLESKSLNDLSVPFQKLELTEAESTVYFGGMIYSKVYRLN